MRKSKAAAAAEFAALQVRVHPPTQPSVAELVTAEMARRDQAAEEEAERQRVARFTGGPCFGCGQTFSAVVQEYADDGGSAAVRDELVPSWHLAGPGRPLCVECHDDRMFGGVTLSDDDWRGGVALAILRSVGRAGNWIAPAVGVRVRGVPLWWGEHSPRPPTRSTYAGTAVRFGFVDVDAVVAAVAPIRPRYRSGPACPQCRAADMWVHEAGGLEAVRVGDSMINMESEPATWCAGCGYVDGRVGHRMQEESTPLWVPNLGLQLDPTHSGN